MKFILFFSSLAFACPMFVEFFPDPTLVSDQLGEYVEIRLDDFQADSMYVAFENKTPLAFPFPKGNRFVLVHDSLLCPQQERVSCALLQGISLPNSRESFWKLRAGACVDSVTLPKPKPGAALQRVRESDQWVTCEGTLGEADPNYEVGLNDCGIGSFKAATHDDGWMLSGWLEGCDSSMVYYSTLDLFKLQGWQDDSMRVSGKFQLDVPGEASWVRLHLPKDDAPANDSLDTLLLTSSKPPLIISEVHHCPLEPEPEWVELYNASRYSLPLSKVRFLGRSSFLVDSIKPYESILVTRDSIALRNVLGFSDVRILQLNFGYLSNTGGSLVLAVDSTVVDSVAWDKNTAKCPAGFNPHSMLAENTPGFQGRTSQKFYDTPLRYSMSARVVRKNGNPLRVRVESEFAVSLKLLDSTHKEVWSFKIPESSKDWWVVPVGDRLSVGVGYVLFSVGDYASVAGIVVRP